MLQLKIESKEEPASSGSYTIHFEYVRVVPEEVLLLFKQMGAPVPATNVLATIRECYCTIHKGDCKIIKYPCGTPNSYVGISKCSPKDNFNRRVGRKIAFTRAICVYPPHVRKLLWAAFLTLWPPTPTKPPKVKPKGASNVVVMQKVGTVPISQATAA